ncbi:MAG TPA: hypothetical protein DIW23_04190 [Anaerolineae bacterium]|nr:hypothetical protein [Anaerolineae bacterium]
MVVIVTSLAISGAMILLVVYWLVTKSFETVKTIFAMLAIMLLLALCVGLAINHQVRLAAWILIVLMLLLNVANMLGYGIATSASAAYLIPILLAMFCIGTTAGYVIAFLGCVIVFVIAFLQSKEKIKTFLPYQVSHLTFDAPVLSLVYILITFITGSWITPLKEFLFQ